MKKKKTIVTLGIIFFLFFINLSDGKAKTEKMTCNYKLTFEEATENSTATYMNFQVTVYDDDTHIIQTYMKKELSTINQKFYSGGFDYFSADGVNRGHIGYNIRFKDNFDKVLKESKGCPDIYSHMGDSSGTDICIEFTKDGSEAIQGWSGYAFTHYDVAEQIDKIPDNPETKKPTVTSSCTKSALSNDLGMSGLEITFQMYSDGTKKFCTRDYNSTVVSCAKAGSEKLILKKSGVAGHMYLEIPKEEVPKIFNQRNFHDVDHNNFVCPSNLYLVQISMISESQSWLLTTEKSSSEITVETEDGTLADNGEKDTILDNMDITISNDGFSFGTFDGCETLFGSNSEFIKWLSNLLKLVQIGLVVLVIILSGIDAISALSSFEEKGSKKFYKNLLTRLICIAIIFLIPSLITVFLNLFASNSLVSEALKNPYCGLLKI